MPTHDCWRHTLPLQAGRRLPGCLVWSVRSRGPLHTASARGAIGREALARDRVQGSQRTRVRLVGFARVWRSRHQIGRPWSDRIAAGTDSSPPQSVLFNANPRPLRAQVVTRELSSTDQMLIIGCDGLWDTLSAEDAWALVQVGVCTARDIDPLVCFLRARLSTR